MNNLYVMVEGNTEAVVLPLWLKVLAPQLQKKASVSQKLDNSYYLFNAQGYPSIIYQHLPNAIADVNDHQFYDYLVVCFDTDQETIEERIQKTKNFLEDEGLVLKQAELIFCLADCCIETWFLGHRKLYKRNPENQTLIRYTNFYNVAEKDPEAMLCHDDFKPEIQQFHKKYFKLIARERNFTYRESRPGQVCDPEYLAERLARQQETKHLASFASFTQFFRDLNRA